jgi:UDPglucose 6-dehydrogenase
MRLSVLGAGYVGLVTAACFADLGNDVTCHDIDTDKIDRLKRGDVPIYEPGLEELIHRNVAEQRLVISADLGEAVANREVVFICVGTPQRSSGKADLTYVLQAAVDVARQAETALVLVIKSTVPVGTNTRVRRLVAEVAGAPIVVASNPEFLREGAAIKDFQNPDRIVVGAADAVARNVLGRLYAPLVRMNRPLLVTTPETAELVKYAANAMLASRISLMNALSGLCERVGADIKDVARGIGLDDRIGPRFLQASPGYGGSCFPKDVRSLVDTMESHQLNAGLFRAIDQVNEVHKKSHLTRLQRLLPDLFGRTVAVWGLAFKPRTDDIRESPALTLIEQLLEAGAGVVAYDPEAMSNAKRVFPRITYVSTPYDATREASAVFVMTEWDVFRTLDLGRVRSLMREPIIIDCRNIYDPDEIVRLGFDYAGVGRPMRRRLVEDGGADRQSTVPPPGFRPI